MNKKPKQPYPGPEVLRELYVEQELSKAKIAHRFGVTSVTAHRWLLKAGLVPPNPGDVPEEQRIAQLRVKRDTEEQLQEEPLAGELVDEESAALPAVNRSEEVGPKPALLEEELTAFQRLSSTQRKAVYVLAEHPEYNNKALADAVGVTDRTIFEWKCNATFQEALKELLLPAFKSEALLMLIKDLRRVLDTGKSRPEDRKLLAEITGATQGDQLTVNVGIATDGFFGNRYR